MTAIPTRIEVTLPVPPGMTETSRGESFEPTSVEHRAIILTDGGLHRSVWVYAADGPRLPLWPGLYDAEIARYPQPGPWFDAVVEQMRASVGGAS